MSLVHRFTISANGVIRQLLEHKRFHRSVIAHVAILCKIGIMRKKNINIHIETVTNVSIRPISPVLNGRSFA